MNILRASSLLLLCASLVLPAALAQSESDEDTLNEATPLTSPTSLKLINGWVGAGFGTNKPSIELINGIAHFRGTIETTGTSSVPFILASKFRPTHVAYIPVDMCNATNGRLIIETNGTVIVQAETSFSNAKCFTSLDGASYVVDHTGFKALSTINGWTSAPFSTATAQYKNISGIVHLKGAIATSGTNQIAFKLPAGNRPSHNVYVPVDMCNATNGRLIIEPTGDVIVQTEKAFSNAQCFTSLDGVWFVVKDTNFHTLSLTNGWAEYSTATQKAKVIKSGGVVYFEGAIATSGTNSEPFTLPSSDTPSKVVYIPIDLCNAAKGRIILEPNGIAYVQAESSFSSAQCFTSLEGASFVY